jgi:hypothetical protein
MRLGIADWVGERFESESWLTKRPTERLSYPVTTIAGIFSHA